MNGCTLSLPGMAGTGVMDALVLRRDAGRLLRRGSGRYGQVFPLPAGPVRRGGVRREATLNDTRRPPGSEQSDPADPADPPIAALLLGCARKDEAAFRALYRREAARLHGIALRITRERVLAADAVHDVFVSIWQHASAFDPARGAAEAWLTSIARYRALDIVRRRAREVTGAEPPEVADPEPDALTRLAGTAEVAALRRCLDLLDTEKRRLVTMAFLDGLSHSELATRLGMALGTVKSSIRRGLAGLRRCLEP